MFYLFNQNNSGGDFITDDKVCRYVIIESDNTDIANDIAESKGIYFDGCDADIDCPCCGDRWHRVDHCDAKDMPLIYGKSPNKLFEDNDMALLLTAKGETYCRVYYNDGRVEEFVR